MNKTKPKKFTFKKQSEATGLASVGAGTPSIDIKYAGVEVGYIHFNDSWNSNSDRGIRVHLMIPKEVTPESKCPWKWGCMNHKFDSADEAKKYLNDNFEKISSMIFIEKE
jgi:hypothetical protein